MPWLADEVLRTRRADVIKLEITGDFDGANAVDYTVNPAVGLPAMTGTGGREAPTNHVLPAWDIACGLTAAFGLVSATVERARTGEGRSLRVALSDVAFATVGHLGMLAEAALGGADRPPSGNDLYGAFGRDFPTADGERVMIVALTPKQWSGLVKVCGIADAVRALEAKLGADLAEEGARYTHRDAIAALVGPWVAARPLAEVAAGFDAAGVSWGPYQTVREALARDRRASTANPMFTMLEQPGVGAILAAGSPLVGSRRAAGAGPPGAEPRRRQRRDPRRRARAVLGPDRQALRRSAGWRAELSASSTTPASWGANSSIAAGGGGRHLRISRHPTSSPAPPTSGSICSASTSSATAQTSSRTAPVSLASARNMPNNSLLTSRSRVIARSPRSGGGATPPCRCQ